MREFEYAIIDLDLPVFKCSAAAQKTWYDLYDGNGELVGEFSSAKFCKEHLQELTEFLDVDISDYKRVPRLVVGEFEDAVEALDGMIKHFLKISNAKQGWFSIGGKGNFRDDLARLKKYKGQRSSEKPYYFKALREYAIKKYQPIVSEGMESDDLISMRLYEDYLLGLKSKDPNKCKAVMIDLEKDCRTTPSWHLDPKIDKEPVWVSTLEANRWCLTQAICGDSADNYSSVEGYGEKKAKKYLEDCKTTKEMWDKTLALYEEVYSDKNIVKSWTGEEIEMTPEERMIEHVRLAFMLREGDIENDWKVLKGE